MSSTGSSVPLQGGSVEPDTTTMSEPDDVTMAEPGGSLDPRPLVKPGYLTSDHLETGNEVGGPEALLPMDEDLSSAPPQPDAPRTRLQSASYGQVNTSTEAAPSGYGSAERGVDDGAIELLNVISDAQLIERVVKVVTSVAEAPTASGEPGIGGSPRVAHCARIKSAVNTVFEKHTKSICRSRERPDLRLAQEEAYGHVAVDLIIGPA